MSQILVIFSILSNFWRTLEMPLVTYGNNLILTWSENCVICEVNRVTVFSIKNANLYVPVVTLSTQNNTKLLQQLKSGFKRTIKWNNINQK